MNCKGITIRSTAALLMSTMLMTGCATVPKVAGNCPPLSPPPVAAVDAMQAADDSAIDAWVVQLERHYQKLDACRGLT